MPTLKKWVWLGAISGVAVSFILGIVFVLVFYLANTKLFDAKASAIFKGCICWVASLLITVVAFSMLKFYNLERKWRHKLEDGASRNTHARTQRWSMFLLAGSATLREGIESVLFLTGVSAGSSVKSVIIPGLLGILLGALVGFLVFYTGHSIRSLKWFFVASASVLLLIAAGMVVNGTAFFQNAGLFGAMWPYELRPWANLIMWDTSGCCNPDTNQFWAMMRALFGYQAIAMNIQLLYYCVFWALTLALLWYKYYNGTLTDAKVAALADNESFVRHQRDAEEGGDVVGGGDGDGDVEAPKSTAGADDSNDDETTKESVMKLDGSDSAIDLESGLGLDLGGGNETKSKRGNLERQSPQDSANSLGEGTATPPSESELSESPVPSPPPSSQGR